MHKYQELPGLFNLNRVEMVISLSKDFLCYFPLGIIRHLQWAPIFTIRSYASCPGKTTKSALFTGQQTKMWIDTQCICGVNDDNKTITIYNLSLIREGGKINKFLRV